MALRKKAKLVITSVTLERHQLKRLQEVAQRERRSRSFLIRDAVEHELARYGEVLPRETCDG